jgi:hypothetical protein
LEVPVVNAVPESMMQEMWDAQASAFEVVESAYVDGRAGRRREREREQETLEKYRELARHLETTFEGE